MAVSIVLRGLVLIAATAAAKREEVWFESAIDHFDLSSTAVFKQRCLVDASAMRARARSGVPPPPVFFYTGNEGPIEEFAASAGLLDELAPRFGALVAFCEHRYYGKSMPYGPGRSGSFARNKVGKLSVEQALADFAMVRRRSERAIAHACHLPSEAHAGANSSAAHRAAVTAGPQGEVRAAALRADDRIRRFIWRHAQRMGACQVPVGLRRRHRCERTPPLPRRRARQAGLLRGGRPRPRRRGRRLLRACARRFHATPRARAPVR